MRVKGKSGWKADGKRVDAPYRCSYTSPAYKGIMIGSFPRNIDDDSSIWGFGSLWAGLTP
jgi:hypothetical protein